MRVLILASIFSFLSISSCFSFDIRGEIPDELRYKLISYYRDSSVEDIEKLLDRLGYYVAEKNDDYIKIEKKQVIKSLTINGNRRFLKSTLLKNLPISIGDPIYYDTVYKIYESFDRFYKNNGFIDALLKVSNNNGDIVISVNEGDRYYIDEIIIKSDVEEKRYIFKATPYSDDLIKYYLNPFKRDLKRKYNLWNIDSVKDDFIPKGRYISITTVLDPTSYWGRNLLLSKKIVLGKGERYKLDIKGLRITENDRKEVEEYIYDNLDSFDTFAKRSLEVKLEDLLMDKGYIKPEVYINIDNEAISVDIRFEQKTRKIGINIYHGDDKLELSNLNLIREKIVSGNEDDIKQIILDYFRKEGYNNVKILNFDFKVYDDEIKVDIKIDLGEKRKIRNLYLQGELLYKNIDAIYDESNLDKFKQMVYNEAGKKGVVKGVDIEKYENGDLYLKVEVEEIKISDVLSNSERLGGKVFKRYFRNDNRLTLKKWYEIHDYIMRNKNAEYIFIDTVSIDNNTFLIINKIDGKPNRIFGGVSFDSVDKLSMEMGYNRFDFLEGSRTLTLKGRVSFKERYLIGSLGGPKTIFATIDDFYSVSLKDRDEDDFKFNQGDIESFFRWHSDRVETIFGLNGEYLDIKETDYSLLNDKKFRKEYLIFHLPLTISIKTKDYELLTNWGGRIQLYEQFSISNKDNFNVYKLSLNLYKTFKRDYLIGFDTEVGRGEGKDIPLTYLFTLGGPYKMKAFSYRELGSKDLNGGTVGDRSYLYSRAKFGYRVNENIIFGPFFEYAGIGDRFGELSYYKDLGLELNVIVQELGFISMSYGYNPFNPCKGSHAFYINFGVSF
ncbi:MAG: BamA/TamA family outer membrane protein [Deferribacterales bacterium]